jgi:hypothetical protein
MLGGPVRLGRAEGLHVPTCTYMYLHGPTWTYIGPPPGPLGLACCVACACELELRVPCGVWRGACGVRGSRLWRVDSLSSSSSSLLESRSRFPRRRRFSRRLAPPVRAVQLDAEDDAALLEYCAREGLTLSQGLRQLIGAGLKVYRAGGLTETARARREAVRAAKRDLLRVVASASVARSAVSREA